ncbi:hypothetical protein AYL99_06486 [Fonsecaea erecta]|uniref:Uncharacterized protein n=1 Tax=Fonsecaea erecta TaxID=1367422 RepID=A0A178ZHC9_9EURO|nr:hypothetical protein AYL99_06486 [Fonsecaea erecta]OAP59188.1 hypothetical protein AYL99_06486 [Fonsecaea erecta]
MATPHSSYIVYLILYLSPIQNHHAIFVGIQPGARGQLCHVVGSMQQGMRFEARESGWPLTGVTCEWMKPLGRVSQDKFAEVEGVCRTVPPPAKQFEKNKLLVPKDQLRHCQHWTEEAIAALKAGQVLEPLGPDDSTDVIRRH